MFLNVPFTSVPNTQSFPDNAYPASAYYGINSTLAAFNTGGASGGVGGDNGGSNSLMPAQMNTQGLVIAFLLVIGAVVAWHLYYK